MASKFTVTLTERKLETNGHWTFFFKSSYFLPTSKKQDMEARAYIFFICIIAAEQ